MKTDVKYPCRGCKYFTACGENTRTAPCKGRALSDKKNKITAMKPMTKP